MLYWYHIFPRHGQCYISDSRKGPERCVCVCVCVYFRLLVAAAVIKLKRAETV